MGESLLLDDALVQGWTCRAPYRETWQPPNRPLSMHAKLRSPDATRCPETLASPALVRQRIDPRPGSVFGAHWSVTVLVTTHVTGAFGLTRIAYIALSGRVALGRHIQAPPMTASPVLLPQVSALDVPRSASQERRRRESRMEAGGCRPLAPHYATPHRRRRQREWQENLTRSSLRQLRTEASRDTAGDQAERKQRQRGRNGNSGRPNKPESARDFTRWIDSCHQLCRAEEKDQ